MFGRRRAGGAVVVVPGSALLTREGGGVRVARVAERAGILVDVDTGEPVDMVSLLVVAGLPEL